MKCVLTMKSAPFWSKKRSGLVFLWLKIAVTLSKASHMVRCVSVCIRLATCVVDLFLEAACAGWRTFTRGEFPPFTAHKNSPKPAKIERLQTHTDLQLLQPLERDQSTPSLCPWTHTHSRDNTQRTAAEINTARERDEEQTQNLCFKPRTDQCYPKGLKDFWKSFYNFLLKKSFCSCIWHVFLNLHTQKSL